ncbi:MAG: iron-containing alcohol dehydrogenase [Veillonellaceae bacterium]|nr:iron-containing alcohol dehydrogenase [Veillonellaceae bacterium]
MNCSGSFFELRKFVAPEFIFGIGASELAGRYAQNYGAQKVLLVTDEVLRTTTPWVENIQKSLTAYGLPFVIFDQVSPNPTSFEIMNGAGLYSSANCNAIVALGGGSVIDCAKGIGIVVSNYGDILTFNGIDKVTKPMPPLISVPTTSGSASEVSQFAIIRDEKSKTKISIVSKAILPDVGLIDPELTTTMDSYLTACTGLDALTHAVEAYVSNVNSLFTDLHALEAVRLIWTSLAEAIAAPDNLYWRSQMSQGSLQAGLAFSNAILGAAHALSHSLGGHFNLAHGECNALLLGPVVEYNYCACPDRFNTLGKIMGVSLDTMPDDAAAKKLRDTIENFRHKVGLSHTLRSLNVTPADINCLAANAASDVCLATNPRSMTIQEIEAIYEKAL